MNRAVFIRKAIFMFIELLFYAFMIILGALAILFAPEILTKILGLVLVFYGSHLAKKFSNKIDALDKELKRSRGIIEDDKDI